MGFLDEIVAHQPDDDAPDTAQLAWVIDLTEGLIATLLEADLSDIATVDEELGPHLGDGLIELRDAQLPAVRRALGEGQIKNEDLDRMSIGRELDTHGLRGKQLKAKVKGIGTFLRRLKDWRLPKWLRKLLAYLNIVLESLADVIPPAGAIAELKSGVEWALEYEDQDEDEDEDDDDDDDEDDDDDDD